ncbi:hypothetical protein LY78DRAFT_661181 [Colletotrichum sublineola]|nr:hypothetical protein LY78DRAFT_661181 [Colletotrichum sublineola]
MLTDCVSSQQRVCRSGIEHLRIAGTHISFAPGCKRRMWQHVIRFHLSPTTAAFKQWDRIARELYLVRPDGSSWGADWDRVVHRKIQAGLSRCASEATHLGLVRETGGERVWEDWTRGFLCVDWDGSCFDPDYAHTLLQQASEAKDDQRRQRQRYEYEVTALAAQVRDLGQLPVIPPRRYEEEDDDDDDDDDDMGPAVGEPARRSGQQNTVRNENELDKIVPFDSVSKIVPVNSYALSSPSVPRGPRPGGDGGLALAPSAAGNAGANAAAASALACNNGPAADVAAPAARDIARFWADKSLAELEDWLRQGWARLFDLRVLMLEALFGFPLAVGRDGGRQPDRRGVVAIREAREKLLEEIFLLEDAIDDRRRPLGAGPLLYPGRGQLYKYFLGGDGPSPAMEARVLAAHASLGL